MNDHRGNGDPERSADAGEYVLGSLHGTERAAFERLLAGDAALQAEVYAWQDRLLGLCARVPAVPPRAGAWSGIEAGLTSLAASASAAEASPPAAPAGPRAQAAANDPLWRRLRRWQASSAVAIAAVLVLATLLLLRPPVSSSAAADRYLALLQAPDRSTGWVVEGEPGGTLRLVPIGAVATVPAGRTLQFWTKPEGAAGPTSLGLVRPGVSVALAVSRLPALGARQLFELTLEPEGGSPIGRPTGPVLYVGRAVRI